MDQNISKMNIDVNPIDFIVATRNIAICYRGIEEYKKSIDSLKEGDNIIQNNEFFKKKENYRKKLKETQRNCVEYGNTYREFALYEKENGNEEGYEKYFNLYEKYVKESYQLSKELKNNFEVNGSLVNLSNIYIDKYKTALSYIKNIQITKSDPSYDAIMFNKGLINMELGNYREALEYFMNDLDYCEEVDDILSENKTLMKIGETYYKWRYFEEAKEYYLKAYELSEKFSMSDFIEDIETNIKLCQKAINCEKEIESVMNNVDKVQLQKNQFDSFLKACEIYHKKHPNPNPKSFVDSSVLLCKCIFNQRQRGLAIKMRGISEFANKNYGSSLNYLLKCHEILNGQDMKSDIPEVLYLIGECYKKQNMKDIAVKYYNMCNESINNIKKNEDFEDFEEIKTKVQRSINEITNHCNCQLSQNAKKRKFTNNDVSGKYLSAMSEFVNNSSISQSSTSSMGEIYVPAIPNSVLSSSTSASSTVTNTIPVYYHIYINKEPDCIIVSYPQNNVKNLTMKYLFNEITLQFSRLNGHKPIINEIEDSSGKLYNENDPLILLSPHDSRITAYTSKWEFVDPLIIYNSLCVKLGIDALDIVKKLLVVVKDNKCLELPIIIPSFHYPLIFSCLQTELNIERIKLDNTVFTDNLMRMIMECESRNVFTAVTEINLNNCECKDYDRQLFISILPKFPSLHSLSLKNWNFLSEQMTNDFSEYLKICSLHYLDISHIKSFNTSMIINSLGFNILLQSLLCNNIECEISIFINIFLSSLIKLEANGIRLIGSMKEDISIQQFYSSSYLQSTSLNSVHFSVDTNDLTMFLLFQIILSIQSITNLSINNYPQINYISSNSNVIDCNIRNLSMRMFKNIDILNDNISFNQLNSLDLSCSVNNCNDFLLILKSGLSFNELKELKLDYSNLINVDNEIIEEINQILNNYNQNIKISLEKSNIDENLCFNLKKCKIISL